jgi:hydroxyacid-oxoacid transhydrogenase
MRSFETFKRVNRLCVRGGGFAIRSFETRAEYAFETASSNVRFGRGTTREVGDDILGMKINEDVCVFTDENLSNLSPARAVFDSLTRAGIRFEVYDRVKIEPTDKSMQMAIDFCRNRSKPFRAFVAVGGGSVIDTAKTANLYMCNPTSDFLDFVNAPIGKGLPVTTPLAPLIAIPTTAGTGSETTGIAIFDHIATGAKTGIRDRALRPTLGIIDPEHTKHCSKELTAYTGLDVLCHALESFTAIPFRQRGPAPSSPLLRPAYQGSNPLSDIWSGYALQVCAKNIIPAVELGDPEAREQMGLAATAAGVGFGEHLYC